MKKVLVICLALALFAAAGCGNKPEKQQSDMTTQAGAAKKFSLTDPVDGSIIDNFETAKYSYTYDGVEYRFNNEKNYKAFKENPEKYLSR